MLAKVMAGLSLITLIGLLMLLGRGYHTLLLVLVVVMFGLGAFTYTYNRRKTLEWLALVGAIGLLSLIAQGYQTLLLAIGLTICGIGALVFLYYDGLHVWSWWFPDQPFYTTIKRWLRYVLQAITVALAYALARVYINVWTGVDPGNFPTALTALAALTTLAMWLVVIPIVLMAMSALYAVVMCVAAVREKISFPEISGIAPRRWGFRVFGATSLAIICVAAYGLPANTLFVQRAGRIFATNVLVRTEYSYDRTCAVSSERRLVAQLKDRKERQVSIVSIAEEGSLAWFFLFPLYHFTFSTGTCVDQVQP
jgi:hypothetical protein